MLPSHRLALHDIVALSHRTDGGLLYSCQNPDCGHLLYAYHSCGNTAEAARKRQKLPQMRPKQNSTLVEKQHNRQLPTHYFLTTLTLPAKLKPIDRSNQKVISNPLFKIKNLPVKAYI